MIVRARSTYFSSLVYRRIRWSVLINASRCRQRPIFLELSSRACPQIGCTVRRNISVFDKFSLPYAAEDWHSPSFMEGKSVEVKEQWLMSFNSHDNMNKLDSGAYFVVINGWAESGASGGAQKAEEWLSALERRHSALMSSTNGKGVTRNEASSASLLERSVQGEEVDVRANAARFEPTVNCYNAVILAWARSQESIAVVRAERWLNKMKQAKEADAGTMDIVTKRSSSKSSIKFGPNTESYNFFLDVCSKGLGDSANVLHTNALKAEDTLREMIKIQQDSQSDRVVPNTESFNFVLRAWTRCRNDPSVADKVMDVLRAMELYQRTSQDPEEANVKPNTMSYSLAMTAWSVVAGLNAQQSLRTKKGHMIQNGLNDSRSMGSHQCGSSDGYDEVSKAEAILQYMHDLHDAGSVVAADTVSHNIILSAYSKIANEMNSDAPLRAERVLRRMIELHNNGDPLIEPDQVSYNNVIRAWVKIKRPNSGERSEWWLRNMWQEFYESGNENVRPNVDIYNSVMAGFIDNAAKVDRLFTEVIDWEKSEDVPLQPNTESFSVVIRAWLKHERNCSREFSGEGIRNAFKRLEELIIREEKGLPGLSTTPDMFYGILKEAAKKAAPIDGKMLEVACETFKKLKASRHHTDALSYTRLLQIGLKAMPVPKDNGRRTKFIKVLVKSCCDDGLISNGFVSALANSPVWYEGWTIEESERLTKELFGIWPLPKTWSRNVRKGFFLPKEENTRRKHWQLEDDFHT